MMRIVILFVLACLGLATISHAQGIFNPPMYFPTPAAAGGVDCTVSGAGNTVTHSGGNTIYKFIVSGNLVCTQTKTASYCVIAGGGGAGGNQGGGGGAGGMLVGSGLAVP